MRIKQKNIICRKILTATACLLLLSGCSADKAHTAMQPIIQHLTTRYAGRFLIDVPQAFIADDENQAEINGHIMYSKQQYFPAFLQKIRLREEELKNTPPTALASPDQAPFLKGQYALADNRKGVIFHRMEGEHIDDAFRILESHLWDHGVGINLNIDAVDASNPRYNADKLQYPGIYKNDVEEKRAELTALLARIEGWDNITPPPGQGTCYTNVFIKGPPGDTERAANSYVYKDDLPVYITLRYNTYIKEDDTLLERASGIKALIARIVGLKTLRKGKRTINGLQGEEWLTVQTDQSGKKEYLFNLLINEKIGSPQTPYLAVTLTNHNILSEEDTLALWDAVTHTLRPRPGAF
ncbi:T6SS immunity protein Tli4 family protein [Enterobacteriaceae bacterium LUAb1]